MSGLGRCPDLRNPDLGGFTVPVSTLIHVLTQSGVYGTHYLTDITLHFGSFLEKSNYS